MFRFISWLAVGIAAAFLVVVSASFAPAATAWLALGISVGTLVVAAAVAYRYRNDIVSLVLGLVSVLVSAWTIVASVVFTQTTVQNLALASSLAISALAITGLTAHEIGHEYSIGARQPEETSGDRESRLAAAA